MNRREVLSALGMGVGGVALLGPGEARAQEQHHHHDKLHGDCLKACEACSTVCNETFHHCFEKVKDGHAEHHRIAYLTIDCQEFCGLTSELMARREPADLDCLPGPAPRLARLAPPRALDTMIPSR